MRVDVAVEITLRAPLHVGSGAMADALADKPLVRDAGGLPLIPGSSLKGKARHACEQVARSLWGNKWYWDCAAPYPDRLCRSLDHDDLCPVCRLFGSPWYPAPLRFENLRPQIREGLPKPKDWEQLVARREPELRAGVGLSRSRRVAQEEILYSVETYRPSAALVYSEHIQGHLATKAEAGLLLAGLEQIRTIGGNHSRGLGWCRVAVTVSLDGVEQDRAVLLEGLKRWSS